MTKTFMILQGSYKNPWLFSDLRKLAEKIVAYWRRKINVYSLSYFNEKLQIKSLTRAYREKNYQNQDGFDSSIITTCSFATYPKKRDVYFEGYTVWIWLDVGARSQIPTIAVVWENDAIDKQTFQKETEDITEMFSDFFLIDNVFADRMDSAKTVDLFVQGIMVIPEHAPSLTRSIYENKIAQNINQYINYNGKTPYLFAYTSIKNVPGCSPKKDPDQIEFVNLDLLEKDMEAYSEDPAWDQCYRDWIEKGIIEPLKSL